MASSHGILDLGECTANADLSAKQYYFAKLAGDRLVDVPSAATDLVIGVIQNKPASGKAVQLRVAGTTKVVYGGTVTAGDRVGTDNAGKCVTKTADTNLTCGIALKGGSSGEIHEILLTPNCQRSS